MSVNIKTFSDRLEGFHASRFHQETHNTQIYQFYLALEGQHLPSRV